MFELANSILIIFGITGDLAKRKLLPALYELAYENLLPQSMQIIGVSRQDTKAKDIMQIFNAVAKNNNEKSKQALRFLESSISIVSMNIGNENSYSVLAEALDDADKKAGHTLNRLFYLAIPAHLFAKVIQRLACDDINKHQKGVRESRYLIEKPFGFNKQSAQELINLLDAHFEPSQIFRIDHFLAKETAQNILAFRFENPLFRGVWNNKHISHILITASEAIGIEGRSNFYESMGAMRDLVQSHLLQLVALVTMDKPEIMNAEHIHKKKEKLLSEIKIPKTEEMNERTIRAQYKTYREETGNLDSMIETYTALWLEIDSERWEGVPIMIRTGKALDRKVTEITIVFTESPLPFAQTDLKRKNCLTLRIQPDEGIAIDFTIKKPGFETSYEQVQLDFCYDGMEAVQSDAYKRVLFDALRGDATLFATDKEVLECWRISEPILHAWEQNIVPLVFYENKSTGPKEADALADTAQVQWMPSTHTVCHNFKTKERG